MSRQSSPEFSSGVHLSNSSRSLTPLSADSRRSSSSSNKSITFNVQEEPREEDEVHGESMPQSITFSNPLSSPNHYHISAERTNDSTGLTRDNPGSGGSTSTQPPSIDSPIDSPARSQSNSPENSSENSSENSLNNLGPSLALSSGGKPFSQSVILNQVPRFEKLTVNQPQKVSDGSSSYISYLVTSQQYPEETPERVRRRFSDFAKLYDKLHTEFVASAVPPLPDRWRLEYIAGDRFSAEFTTKRSASLERFLFRVSQHPSLRRSRCFAQFLSSNGGGPDTSSISRNRVTVQPSQESAAIVALDHLGETLMNAFAKAKHQSKEMIDARERAERYEQNIATIDKAVVRTSKTQSDLALDFEDMHHQALKLAKLEPESGPELEKLAQTAQGLMLATVQLRQGIDSHFGCALRDMSHYVQALKGMLKQREQRQIDYEALIEYLKRSEHELVAAEHGQYAPTFSSSFLCTKLNELRGVDKEHSRQQRITKLKGRITEFREESTKAKQVSDDYEELAKREVRVFDQTEAIELQQSLAGLSDSYIEFYETVLRDCQALEAEFS